MPKYLILASLALAVMQNTTLVSARQTESTAQQGHTLKLSVHYTGSGPVDQTHKVYVFLFNSTDFMDGEGHPIATTTASSKEETVSFPKLTDSPVYVAVVYDPTGVYEGHSQPPSGSSTALYEKSPNVPEPITIDPAKPTEISLSFDDTHKMR